MWYDVLTVCILTYATFRGAMKGIVWQLAAIASLLMCFFFSGSLSESVAPLIRVEPPLNRWIAMFILYLGFSFVSFSAARVLHQAIESMKIEALDRHLGALLGLLKGGMFSLFLTFFLVTLSHTARESIMESESGYVAAVVIDKLDPIIPGDLHAMLEPYLERLDGPEIEREHHEHEDGRGRDGERDSYVGEERDLRPEERDRLQRERLDHAQDERPRDDGRRKPIVDGRDADDVFGDGAPDPQTLRRDRVAGDDVRPDRGRGDLADDARTKDLRDGELRNGDIRDGDVRGGAPRSRGVRDDEVRDRDIRAGEVRDRDVRDGDLSDVDGARRYPRTRDDRRGYQPPPPDPGVDTARDDSSTDWLSAIPAITGELKDLAIKAWKNTKREHRPELQRRLSHSVPELIRKTVREWEHGRPANAEQEASAERRDLERDIVASLRDDGGDRSQSIDDIESTMEGIPDDVVLKVLRDWRADLRDPKSDPDARTDARTTLTERIRRQLSIAGISIRSLDTATQDRLRRSVTR